MMNSSTIAGIAAAILVAGILIATPFARAFPSWALVESATASELNGSVSSLSLDAAGDIPRKTDTSPDAVVGFAFVELSTLEVIVATIHPTFDDSAQNPFSWHLHAAQLGTGTASSDLCIVSFFPNPTGGIQIQGDTMTINVANSKMPMATDDLTHAVGFVVNPDAGCPAELGVDLNQGPVPLS
ncbi:MAG: hypothetical protein ACREAQ_03450 [Nitrososphaera sp.]